MFMLFIVIAIMFVIYIYVNRDDYDYVKETMKVNTMMKLKENKSKLRDVRMELIMRTDIETPMSLIYSMSEDIMREWLSEGDEARDINVIINEYLDYYEKKCKNMSKNCN